MIKGGMAAVNDSKVEKRKAGSVQEKDSKVKKHKAGSVQEKGFCGGYHGVSDSNCEHDVGQSEAVVISGIGTDGRSQAGAVYMSGFGVGMTGTIAVSGIGIDGVSQGFAAYIAGCGGHLMRIAVSGTGIPGRSSFVIEESNDRLD
ncbi:uncharacterized protein LOC123545700 [Mercenaria mercenaria]|uniref:uncharacterized protein LOC123545700 n=1 Tax=Mercenaria mercenaria TaxID=6596 RepID=UPI00234F3BF8|nr:uncharacterized protein LOC123545700 [Mercenaria mercenaria]